MNNQRSLEVKVGVVTFIALLLLAIGISLGKGIAVGVNQTAITMRFPTSGGIDVSDPVTVNGVRRGVVTSVANKDGAVQVTATLDNVDDLRNDALAQIMMLEITGGKKIEIFPGESSVAFEPANMLEGKAATDFTDLFQLAAELGDDAKRIASRIDTITAAIADLVTDEELIADAKGAIQKVHTVLNEIEEITVGNRQNIEVTLSNLRILSDDLRKAVDKNAPRVDTLLSKFEITLNKTNAAISTADGTMKSAEQAIEDVRGMLNDIKNGSGFASKLLYDEDFSARIDDALNRTRALIEQIRRHGLNTNIRVGTRP